MNPKRPDLLIKKARLIADKGRYRYLLMNGLYSSLGSALFCYALYALISPDIFDSWVAVVFPIVVPATVAPAISWFTFNLFEALAQEHSQLELEVHRRQGLEKELRLQANTDALTGLSNRRAFFEESRYRLKQRSQTLALIDLDFFKQVNDQFGHDVGDHVLIQISQLLSEHFEPEALVARLGGEEFALMSIASEFELAQQLQTLNQQLTQQPLVIAQQQIYISLSAGVVTVMGPDDLNNAIIAADTFLYKAKDNGRCQVRCA